MRMKEPTEKRIIALFLLVFLLLAGITVAAIRNIQTSTLSNDLVNQSHALISEADAIFSALCAGDAGLWSYVLSGDERDLAAGRRGFSGAAEHLEVAKTLAGAGSKQHEDLLQLHTLISRRVDFARDVVNARKQGGPEAARKLIPAAATGLTDIQLKLEVIKDREQALVRQRDKEAFLQSQNTRWIVFTGAGINLLVLVVLYYLVRNTLTARHLAAKVLGDANQKLDATVQERTGQLAAANDALIQENLEQRWSNQALEHQLRYNQLIINSIDDLVFVISKVSNILRVNPAVTRRTGYESQELIGGSLQKLLRQADSSDPASAAKLGRILASLKDGRDLLDSPGILVTKDGRQHHVSFNVFPLRDRDKIVGGVLTIKTLELRPPGDAV
jgi:PAS domain S-box-containing protein